MNFLMNNRIWTILEISKEDIITLYKQETKDDNIETVYGLTRYDNNVIYLNQDMCEDMKKQTLMHELMHCYIKEYVSLSIEEFDEEMLCNISANSHNIINEIVEKYFKK